MSDNAQKLHFPKSIGSRVTTSILHHLQNTGGKAPATVVSMDKTNTIATLKFEMDDSQYKLPQVTVPVHGTEYIRHPLKKGDKGFVALADFDTGNMSGLGDQNPAKFTRPGNLSALCFHPVGNKNFSETDNPKALLHYAPEGTINRDDQKKSKVSVHPTNGVTASTGQDSDKPQHSLSITNDKGVVHQSEKKVTTDAPVHEVTKDQTVGGDHTVAGNVTAAGNISATGAVSGASGNFSGGMSGGGLSFLNGLVSGSGGDGGGSGGGLTSGSLAANVAADNLGLTDGLPVYSDPAVALAALGPGQLYIHSTLGAHATFNITDTGGYVATIPAVPSFYSQGIFVVCCTSHA